MKARLTLIAFVLVLTSFSASNSQAFMHRVNLDVWTQAETGKPRNLSVWFQVTDDQLSHPPDLVKEIQITAPDGSVFHLAPSKDWLAWDRAFWRTFVASDFVSEEIPDGNYVVKVTPEVGPAITESDTVAGKFLVPAVFSYPTAGMTGVPQTPTLRWTAVPGAAYYRIRLRNLDWIEPVYWSPQPKATDFNYYKIPIGDLRPNTNYSVQIEARSGTQDMDMRSRSQWINFKTGSW